MNPCILVFVEIPIAETPRGLAKDYKALLASPHTIPPPNSGIEKPAENVWLIPLDGGLHFLAGLFHELKGKELQVRTLRLGPDWTWLDSTTDKNGQST